MRVVTPSDRSKLTRTQRARLAAEILSTYLLVRWWLTRSGLPRALAATRGSQPESRSDDLAITSMLRLGRAVERTLGALPLDSRCLIRSLVLTRMLARRGLSSTVVFGAKSKPTFQAHSWVEHDGVALLPTGSGFHRLTEM